MSIVALQAARIFEQLGATVEDVSGKIAVLAPAVAYPFLVSEGSRTSWRIDRCSSPTDRYL